MGASFRPGQGTATFLLVVLLAFAAGTGIMYLSGMPGQKPPSEAVSEATPSEPETPAPAKKSPKVVKRKRPASSEWEGGELESTSPSSTSSRRSQPATRSSQGNKMYGEMPGSRNSKGR